MRAGVVSFWIVTLALLGVVPSSDGQGVVVPSAGPINSAMAGASTAAPVDFGGSYWNPAILSGLDDQEVLIGSALAFPSIHLQSSLTAGAVGGLFPPTSRYGEARSDSGVAPGLATGFSFRLTDDSPLTLGVGVFGLVGGGVNFNGSYQVPILTPRQPPRYFGVGPIYSNVSLLSINPMASYQFTDKLAIGGGPILTAGTSSFSPAFFAAGPKGPLGLPTFPSATNTRPDWGGRIPGRAALRAQRELEPGILVQEPGLAGAMGLQRVVSEPIPATDRAPGEPAPDAFLGHRL